MWTISLPITVPVSKKSNFSLNLNAYRNAHFHVLNNAKKNFGEIVGPRLKSIPRMKECSLRYELFIGTRRLCDVSNICSIVDKFFSDVLVDLGKIPDDNYTVVPDVSYSFGALDKDNPRVDVTITLIERDDETMQITLNQIEIETAIRNFVNEQVNLKPGQEINIELKAGRGPEGYTANIDIIAGTTGYAPAPVKAKQEQQPVQLPLQMGNEPEPVKAPSSEAQTESSETTPASDEAAPVDKPAPSFGGLFGSLSRPVNQ